MVNPKDKRPRVIVYEEMDGPDITEFKTDPKGKKKKVIKKKDWGGDPKKLRKEAEKIKD